MSAQIRTAHPVYGPASRPAGDCAAVLIPHNDGVTVPLEESAILWQR
jgi:hypothetical protein